MFPHYHHKTPQEARGACKVGFMRGGRLLAEDTPEVNKQVAGTLHCTALHCTVLRCTALHCTVLRCTALHCTALYCTVLRCTALHCSALYCIVQHCTASLLQGLLSRYQVANLEEVFLVLCQVHCIAFYNAEMHYTAL